ncbi:50S ribosomal protein L17, partial [candidate division KSB1 bacterium]|nr:50S ribosomal protein L17 [candidate division KSB1 bacterium]NIW72640.1 50S ribosomal protein L17 [candidate division KSB1 bacterium]NIX74011.1 50S ribosomal protein L17 [candidate division KSB1 bacterium]
MKHRNKNRTLGRTRNGRTALLRSLAASLIVNGRITTTEAKAKELRPFIERLITKGREEGIHSRRLL